MTTNRRIITSSLTLALFALTPLAAAQTPLLVVRSAGPETFVPADDGLRLVSAMLGQRLGEIPTELLAFADTEKAQEDARRLALVMPLLIALAEHPIEFAVIDRGGMVGPLPNLDVRLIVETASAAKSNRLHQTVRTIAQLADEGATVHSIGGTDLAFVSLPEFGRVVFGPFGPGNQRFVLGVDLAGDGLDLSAHDPPTPQQLADADPIWQAHLDGRAAVAALQRAMRGSGDPQQRHAANMIDQIVGDAPLTFTAGSAVVGDWRTIAWRLGGFLGVLERLGQQMGPMLAADAAAEEPLDRSVLRLIPRDAVMASVSQQNPQSLLTTAQLVAFQTGLFEIVPVIEAMGRHTLLYTSQETGGAGLSSLVVILPDADADLMRPALDDLVHKLNALATPAHGYIMLRSWEAPALRGEAVAMHTLTFPGLPVPLEVSLGLADGRFVAALHPQALLSAVDHWRSGRPSLPESSRFAEAVAALPIDRATQLTFIDLPATAARGYPIAQLAGAAAGNFVRSPRDPQRDPGLITPPLPTMLDGARPLISITFHDGDDVVWITRTDPSLMVNVAGLSGAVGLSPAVLLPALQHGAQR